MFKALNFFTILFAFVFFVAPVYAEAVVGQEAPHSLELPDQSGELRSFESYSGEKGVVVVFVRSADWCPYCQVQMLDLRDKGEAVTALGYSIVTVSYDAPETLKAFTDKHDFPYVMLSDKGSDAIKAFGILNEDFDPDHFAYGVPHPNIYVVGNDTFIRAILTEEGYKKRPQVDAVIDAINALQ